MKLTEWKSRGQQQEVKQNDQQLDGDGKTGLWQGIRQWHLVILLTTIYNGDRGMKKDPFHDVAYRNRWKDA